MGLDSFAIYYPNCYGVFGFYDPNYQDGDTYTIYGWNEECTALDTKMKEIDTNLAPIEHTPTSFEENLFVNNTYIFYADTSKTQMTRGGAAADNSTYKLGLGNNLPQALNAVLAYEIDKDRQEEIEHTLELAEMGLLTNDSSNPDLTYLFRKHQASFQYKEGGNKWQLLLNDLGPSQIRKDKKGQVNVPQSDRYLSILQNETLRAKLTIIATKINKVNAYQKVKDRYDHWQQSKRFNLFADWYKFVLVATNPDNYTDFPDTAENLINELKPLINSQVEALKRVLTGAFVPNPNLTLAENIQHIIIRDNKEIEQQLKTGLTDLNTAINELNGLLKNYPEFKKSAFNLAPAPHDKYYQPKSLALFFRDNNTESNTTFHPLFMDWKISFVSFSDLRHDQTNYKQDLITNYFKLLSEEQDLALNDPTIKQDGPVGYWGTTTLSGHISDIVQKQLSSSLETLQFNSEKINATSQKSDIQAAIQKLKEEHPTFGQVLDGFNKGLVMRANSLQLPVYSPYMVESGALGGLKLIKKINSAVQGQYTHGLYNTTVKFNPFRAGLMGLDEIYLTDSFGRFLSIPIDELVIAHDLIPQNLAEFKKNQALLKPRLVQAARLLTQWIDAEQEQVINNIPINNPICGWVVANNLDQTIMIYNGQGGLLGQLMEDDKEVVFQANMLATWGNIENENPHLQAFIESFTSSSCDFFTTMHQTINQSLEYIDPISFAQYTKYALFASRPIALVRCALQMETADDYFSNQALKVSILQKRRNDKDNQYTQAYEQITYPVQIGHDRLLHDGVIGYWKESDNPINKGIFYATVATLEDIDDKLVMLRNCKTPQAFMKCCPQLTLQGGRVSDKTNDLSNSQKLTLLFDPRGSLTVQSKILPVDQVQIPPILFKAALENIQITFSSFPVITPKDKLHLPLLHNPHIAWKWYQKEAIDSSSFKVLDQTLTITKQQYFDGIDAFFPKIDPTSRIYQTLTTAWSVMETQGWLTRTSTNETELLYVIHLGNIDFSKDGISQEILANQSTIVAILSNYASGILPPIHHTHSGVQEIREGWLQINKH